MDKILNDIEHKLREAAATMEEPYNEVAWQKMEALLDKDKDRRRPLLWFLLAALVAGGLFTFILINRNTAEKSSNSSAVPLNETVTGRQKTTGTELSPEIENPAGDKLQAQPKSPVENKPTAQESEMSVPAEKTAAAANSNNMGGTPDPVENTEAVKIKTPVSKNRFLKEKNVQPLLSANKKPKAGAEKFQNENVNRRNKRNTNARSTVNITAATAEADVPATINENTINKEDLTKTTPATEPPAKEILSGEKALESADTAASVQIKTMAASADSAAQAKPGNVKRNKKAGRFFFALYGGLGSDPVKPFNFSKENPFVPKYGLAAGYKIGKRSAVTIGFNIHRKKYTADTTNYNTKGSSYFSYYKVSEIEAVCKVYEIPLMYHYNIGSSKKYNYFVSAGLSSFIMQKEDYDYYFYYGGALRKSHRTYTKNSHLFASALLGAVAERKLNEQITLQLSPAFAVPLKGIGQGEVKLYSSQLLIGLKYTPGGK